MECISCTDHGSFNRIVINQISGDELGLYCETCETETFGESLRDHVWHQKNGCAFCDGTGRYKLPELDCLIKNDDGSLRHVEFGATEEAVTLCRTHLTELLPHEKSIEDLNVSDRRSDSPIEV